MYSESSRIIYILLPLFLVTSLLVALIPDKVQGETLLGITTRVSVAFDGTQGNDYSEFSDISDDGQFVAFSSYSNNLVSGDTNNNSDIFVHDRITGEIIRASVASDGTQGNNFSTQPSISADGRYVTFVSDSDNLVSGDTNEVRDVFVHDIQTRQTTRVSVASDGTQGNNSVTLISAISPDGRYVAFGSLANNLVEGDTNNGTDTFIHDRLTGETTRISLASDGTQGNWNSLSPSFSSDIRYVAFESNASNLVSDDTNNSTDVFVHDRVTGETTRVSVASDGTEGNAFSHRPSISADGRFIAFYSEASNLVNGDTNESWDVFIRDQLTGETIRASVASDGTQANGSSLDPSISADGRFVVFPSDADNLVVGDTNNNRDIFLHDRQTKETIRISIASDGTQGNGTSNRWPTISSDGHYIAFSSSASNLIDSDTNNISDVFVHERGGNDLFVISGQIVDNAGLPINSVEVGYGNGSVFTNEDGDYLISNLSTGSYTLEPLHSDYQFSPYTLLVTVGPDAAEQNFTGVHCLPSNNLNRTAQNLCPSGIPPLFDLPIDYFGTTFWIASSGNVEGSASRIRRINSWFDHWGPNQYLDGRVGVWSGTTYTTADGSLDSANCKTGVWCYDGHEGIDFASRWYNVGEYIFAAAPGTVIDIVTGWRLENIDNDPELEVVCDSDMGGSDIFAKCYNGLGNQIWIDHGNGYLTIYGHLDNVFVEESQQIETVELDIPIAEMGDTGNSEGIHLHFEVRHDWLGNWPYTSHIDPFGWASSSTMDPWTNQYGATSQWLWKYPGASQEATSQTITTVLTSPSDAIVVSVPSAASPTPFIQLWENSPNQVLSDSQLRQLGTSFLLRLIDAPTTLKTTENSDFISPVTIDIDYSIVEPSHLDESQLALYWYDEIVGNWFPQPTTVNSSQNVAQATTLHTGAFDLQAPLVCPNDVLEPNDNFYSPTPLSTDGNSLTTLFDISTDEDWFTFDANSDRFYHITITNLAQGVNAVLELFDTDGKTQLTFEDGNEGSSTISWFAQSDDRYYVRVSQDLNSNFGCDKTYDISLEEITNYKKIYLPGIFRSN